MVLQMTESQVLRIVGNCLMVLMMIAALQLACSKIIYSSEADYFTYRKGLRNLTKMLNDKMNQQLSDITSTIQSCEESELYDAIMARMGGFGQSEIERWVSHDGSENDNWIYDGTNVRACCSPVFLLHGSIVSTDKLGHFLHSGYEMYYAVRYRSSNPIKKDSRSLISRIFDANQNLVKKISPKDNKEDEKFVLNLSHAQEESGWGLMGTGVKSYADIAANFDGYRFWNSLTQGASPFFICDQGKWKKKKDFQWKEYASDAWDEGVNCSEFAEPEIYEAVNRRIAELYRRNKLSAPTCPVEPEKCPDLVKRYYPFATQALHISCLLVPTSRHFSPAIPLRPNSQEAN